MQAKSSSAKQTSGRRTGPSFTETGRRAQIVAAAIETIAELGYHKASFARIAERAQLSSTGMISYHFDGRGDLMREVVTSVMQLGDAFMRPRIEAENDASARLRAYIESNLDLLAEHPRELAALVEILSNLRPGDAGMAAFQDSTGAVQAFQVEQMRKAQRAGEFREFDPWVMVRAIRAAIDDMVRRAAYEPDLDVRAAGRELADLFDHATRGTS